MNKLIYRANIFKKDASQCIVGMGLLRTPELEVASLTSDSCRPKTNGTACLISCCRICRSHHGVSHCRLSSSNAFFFSFANVVLDEVCVTQLHWSPASNSTPYHTDPEMQLLQPTSSSSADASSMASSSRLSQSLALQTGPDFPQAGLHVDGQMRQSAVNELEQPLSTSLEQYPPGPFIESLPQQSTINEFDARRRDLEQSWAAYVYQDIEQHSVISDDDHLRPIVLHRLHEFGQILLSVAHELSPALSASVMASEPFQGSFAAQLNAHRLRANGDLEREQIRVPPTFHADEPKDQESRRQHDSSPLVDELA